MERFLQVADECDDAIAACMHWCLGSATKITLAMSLAVSAAAGWFVLSG